MDSKSSLSPVQQSRSWFRNAFAWTGTALPLCYQRIVLLVAFACFVQGIHTELWWNTSEASPLDSAFKLDPFGHVTLGSLIGFLLVVRINASNARYWEGRTHWGTIVNASRNLTRSGSTYTSSGKELANLVAAYAMTLKASLRGSRDLSEASPFLSEELMLAAEGFGNQPTAVAAAMSVWVREQAVRGVINPEITRHLEVQIAELVSAQGGCEKIQKTPLPFAYVSMIKLLILVYLITLPMITCSRFGWWSPVLVAVLSLGMFGMEETSVEIEDPFGTNPNCLNLDVLTITIARDTGQLARFSS